MDGEILSDEENHNMEMGFDMENDESNHGVFPDDEAIEVPADDPTRKKKIQPKVVRNPQPKLDALRLMGPRGIGILPNTFKSFEFKGKGHEKEDLNLVMKQLEHWSHRLFPKLTFDDMLKQLEKLGSKKQVQTLIKKMRMDILQSDELIADNPDEPEEVRTEDVFDQLLPSDQLPDANAGFTFSSVTDSQPQQRVISAEDRQRMDRNKELALERRKSKLLDRGNNIINFSQAYASQNDSVTSSDIVTVQPEDDLDEDMLKAFDDDGVINNPPEPANMCISTEVDTLSTDETSAKKGTSPLKSYLSMSEDSLNQKGTLESNKTVLQEDQTISFIVDENTPLEDICTEDDILENL